MSKHRGDQSLEIERTYQRENQVTVYPGRCEALLDRTNGSPIQLVITSPPYNMGKKYGGRTEHRLSLEQYRTNQRKVINACVRRLALTGSVCWQVGSYVQDGELVPLDIVLYDLFIEAGLVLRNRIIWGFDHGLTATNRLAGRYETILWFSRPGNDYVFNLDEIRIPQKYPGKRHYKGPKRGELSGNPLGKNPGDRWSSDVWNIPNVKARHVEKTSHPCQFPVELAERLILALSRPGDLVFDPYMGVGSSLVAALLHERRSLGAETVTEYRQIARERLKAAAAGVLATRPMERQIPTPSGKLAVNSWRSIA
jgi:adenine-specific DNA-methyltransferase